MKHWFCLVLFLISPGLSSAPLEIQIDYRPQPGRITTVESQAEVIATSRVIKDRGFASESANAPKSEATTSHIIYREKSRFTAAPLKEDGSFQLLVEKLQDESAFRLLDGSEIPNEQHESNVGYFLEALISASWKVDLRRFSWPSADPKHKALIRETATSALNQVLATQPIQLSAGKSAMQVMNLQLPVMDIAVLGVEVNISNTLLKVEGGVAHVQLVYQMNFSIPQGPYKIAAEGTGGGLLQYDLEARAPRTFRSSSFMTVTTQGPEGTVETKLQMLSTDRTFVRVPEGTR